MHSGNSGNFPPSIGHGVGTPKSVSAVRDENPAKLLAEPARTSTQVATEPPTKNGTSDPIFAAISKNFLFEMRFEQLVQANHVLRRHASTPKPAHVESFSPT